MELCCGNLADVVNGKGEFRAIKRILRGNTNTTLNSSSLNTHSNGIVTACEQISQGVLHLHKLGVLHGDLKPENILVKTQNQTLHYVVSDFGVCKLSKANDETFSGVIGSGGWVPHECGLGRVTTKVDVFSCGVVFWYIWSDGGHCFGERVERERNIAKGRYFLSGGGLIRDLVERMIKREPRERFI